ncbi:zinc finger protein VAR3, chloroplastic-like [Lycium barbarum]|uniref:zinc finger protein VAR3, chloroplastic-like n=1 Tax=Lycium barbarum TaxID=112863 RepID=UPI00293EBBE3|nr:zinc finger protein VAR3, chloroplastic-like [Lycium barbarum]
MFKGSNSILVKTPFKILKIIQIQVFSLHSKNPFSNGAIQFILEEGKAFQTPQTKKEPKPTQEPNKQNEFSRKLRLISHPWPEWMNLMDKLLKSGYLGNAEMDANQIRTACLNFARDRFDLISKYGHGNRYLSQQDIGVLAGCGCPSTDRKVVNSGKRLRVSLGIEEGNVCSFCILRGSCERAYIMAHEDQGGRTVDVMRLLLTYGLDPVTGAVQNKPSLNKRVKESARKLLKEIVSFSSEELTQKSANPSDHQEEGQINVLMKHGDWFCPKCNFLNFSRNVKCLQCNGLFHERLSKLSEEQDHLPLKKGDWICYKCHFMNFARNTRCLQCKEKPPKRQLNSGEWECESCNYINFKRNMVCLKCDHRRPKASSSAGSSSRSTIQNRSISRTRPYFGEVNQETDKDVDEWELVQSDNEDLVSSMVAGFVDFPVLGGNSELSRDAKKQERWKREMSAREREKADELQSSFIPDSGRYTGDEEMAEWFGHKSTQNAGIY